MSSAAFEISVMPTTFTGAYAGRPLTVDMQTWYTGIETGSPAYYAVADMLTIMERFNGRTYQPIPPRKRSRHAHPLALPARHAAAKL